MQSQIKRKYYGIPDNVDVKEIGTRDSLSCFYPGFAATVQTEFHEMDYL